MITRAIRALKLRLLDPYVHAAASILSIVIVAMVISSCEWCDDSNSSDASNIVTPITIGQPDATATVSTTPGHGSVPPSTTISHELRVTSAPAEGATVTFTPPPGSWAPGFVGIQPDNPNGPPPYVFTNVPVGVTITPNYRLDLPGSSNFLATYAQFSISTSVGNVTQFNCLVQVHRPDLQDCAAPAPVIGRSARVIGTPSEAPIPADKVDWSAWLSEFYLNSDSDMDTDRCQQIFDLLQDPSLFVALRFPTIPEIQSEENSWQAPVAFREGATPQISLLSYAS
ncbi:MAG: hypothetical protein GY842_16345, partial [bacterium]|nr:hypothetical protein [bacterium]